MPFKASVTIFGEVETTVYVNAGVKRGVHLFACVCAYRKCVGLLLHFPPVSLPIRPPLRVTESPSFSPSPCKKYQPKINCQRVAQMKEYEVEILCLSVSVSVCVCVYECVSVPPCVCSCRCVTPQYAYAVIWQ